MYGPSDEHHYY